MAKLLSEDEQVKTSFELILLNEKFVSKQNVSWISYRLILHSAEQKLIYEEINNPKGAGDYVFALKPVNEIEKLIEGINNFLKDDSKQMFSFEPLEPSFEFILERSHRGFSAIVWIDAGNVISDHFTWDGFGLRFFTGEKNIKNFLEELNVECRDVARNVSTKGNHA